MKLKYTAAVLLLLSILVYATNATDITKSANPEKRSANFLRFGRNAEDHQTHTVTHFVSELDDPEEALLDEEFHPIKPMEPHLEEEVIPYYEEPQDTASAADKRAANFMRFGRRDQSNEGKRAANFMRFGKRAANFMRFGKRAANFMRFGKRAANFMRFGRTPPGDMLSDDYGESDKREMTSLSAFGKREPTEDRSLESSDVHREKRAANFMRFGKRAANFMRFGKRAANFMRFGRDGGGGIAEDDLRDRFMAYGKREPHDAEIGENSNEAVSPSHDVPESTSTEGRNSVQDSHSSVSLPYDAGDPAVKSRWLHETSKRPSHYFLGMSPAAATAGLYGGSPTASGPSSKLGRWYGKRFGSDPGALRFGKRWGEESDDVDDKRFGADPGALRFGKRFGADPGALRFGKRFGSDPGALRFGKRFGSDPGALRFGKRSEEEQSGSGEANGESEEAEHHAQ